jgi:siroheme synthase
MRQEVLEYRSYGVEPVVIPGVSSVLCAPLLANIDVTRPGVADAVWLGTGVGTAGAKPELPAYAALLSLVLVMAVGRLAELCESLQALQWSAATAVAIIESAATPQQRVTTGTLQSIAKIAAERAVKAPAVVVVGQCALSAACVPQHSVHPQ